jgi:hypothetical protein
MDCCAKNCELYKLPFDISRKNVQLLEFGNKPNYFEYPPELKESRERLLGDDQECEPFTWSPHYLKQHIKNLTDSNYFKDKFLKEATFGNNEHGFDFIVSCKDIVHVCVVKCKRIEWDILRLLYLGNNNKDCPLWKLPKSILLSIISLIAINSELEQCDTSMKGITEFLESGYSLLGWEFQDVARAFVDKYSKKYYK